MNVSLWETNKKYRVQKHSHFSPDPHLAGPLQGEVLRACAPVAPVQCTSEKRVRTIGIFKARSLLAVSFPIKAISDYCRVNRQMRKDVHTSQRRLELAKSQSKKKSASASKETLTSEKCYRSRITRKHVLTCSPCIQPVKGKDFTTP